jgi:hypothetical protein
MRYCLSAIVLLMSTISFADSTTSPGGLESLSWMVGSWTGSLGPQTVEETWSSPRAGNMNAGIRLSTPEGVQMMEFIVIREVHVANGEDSLMLHLRQFSPELELRNSQDMQLKAIATQSVTFATAEPTALKQLRYTGVAQGQLSIEVTMANGNVFTAHLEHN